MILQRRVTFITVQSLLWTALSLTQDGWTKANQSGAETDSNPLTERGVFTEICGTTAGWCVNNNDNELM